MLSYDIVEWGQALAPAKRDTPKPVGTEVLLKVKCCGVCHSDVHIRDGFFDLGGGRKFMMGERGMKLPMTMGHEAYGTVVAVGPDVMSVPLGAERIAYPWVGCGKCARCLEGNDNLCAAMQSIGVQRPGGYADHVLVPHPRYLVDPQGVDPAMGATLACSGITTYSAIGKLMPFAPEDWIVILGAGGLGLLCVSVLKAMGHSNIISVDIDAGKFPAARAAGAAETVDGRDAGALKKLQEISGSNVYGALDFVGSSDTSKLGVAALRKGGRYVVVGLFGGELPLSTVSLAQRAISIQGSYVGTVDDLKEMVALAKSGKLKPIPIERRPLADVDRTLDELKAGKIVGRVVVEP
jgi:D-arabinose 1-dehydrogenase-like Zn-dependent alcohol dehydrogenase